MLVVVTGGSGSGKSIFAEQYVEKLGEGRRIYVATMKIFGEEEYDKVVRHQKMREQRNFETIECYTGIEKLFLKEDSIVLLECMANLTANEMFEKCGAGEFTKEVIIEGVKKINCAVKHLIVVTNEVFSDGRTYSGETEKYIQNLGEINQKLGIMSDELIEIVYSIPIWHKMRKEN